VTNWQKTIGTEKKLGIISRLEKKWTIYWNKV